MLSIQSSDYTTKKILKTARWAGYEETTEWIRHVAMVFRDLGHHKVAIEYFKKALELDATSVLAMGGIGLTYAAMGELDQAIEWTLKAADIRNDPQFPLAKGYDYVKVAEWYDRLANRAQALLYYKKTLEIDPSKYQTWVEYLKLLHTEKNFEEIVNILERLNDQESAIPGRSRLTALCFESIQDGQIHSSVFRDVSLQGKRFDLISQMYRRALEEATNSGKSQLPGAISSLAWPTAFPGLPGGRGNWPVGASHAGP